MLEVGEPRLEGPYLLLQINAVAQRGLTELSSVNPVHENREYAQRDE